MYTQIFGLTRPPFQRGLESQELFQAPMFEELHSRLRYLVDHRAIGLLTGEPGCGKSTALRRLRDELHPEQVRSVYLHDTDVNPGDFCRQIAWGLGLEPSFTRAQMMREIREEIDRLTGERKLTVLLVLDEAQALRPDVLALLPRLSSFDWDRDARLAILLAGQSGLRQTLRRAHLESLAQRITVRYALRGLDRDTTQLYLQHRLRLAGLDRPLFTEPAVEALWQSSQGLQRSRKMTLLRSPPRTRHFAAVLAAVKASLRRCAALTAAPRRRGVGCRGGAEKCQAGHSKRAQPDHFCLVLRQGVMRRIDTLAHYALAAAATERATQIEAEHVLKATEETRT